MKLIVQTGRVVKRENRLVGMTAKFASGSDKGKHLYKVPENQRKVKWENKDGGFKVTTEYDLSEGTKIEFYGYSRNGEDRKYFRKIFQLDSSVELGYWSAENLDFINFEFVGRLKLVVDLRSEEPIDFESGF